MRVKATIQETWGQRFARYRKKAGYSQRDIEVLLGISHASLARLEKLVHDPDGRTQRGWAAQVLIYLGYDLAEFGLSEKDLPVFVTRSAIEAKAKADQTGDQQFRPTS